MRRARAIFGLACAACGAAPAPAPPPAPTAQVAAAPSVARAAPPAPKAVRWAIPSCPLRYEILTVERAEPLSGDAHAEELVTFITVDATPSGDRLRLRIAPTVRPRHGKHLPYGAPDPGFPPLELTTDGVTFEPTVVTSPWFGLGTQGGLSWLFPPLTKGYWTFLVDNKVLNAGYPTFVASRDPRVMSWSPSRLPVDVETSTTPEGRLVVRANGREAILSNEMGPEVRTSILHKRNGTSRFEHVILPNGRLLRAHLERDAEFEASSTTTVKLKLTQRSDVHLVAACDGPTEPSLEPVLTREERAVAAVGALDFAMIGSPEERASVPAAFSSAVRARGDDALLAAIARFQKARGEHVWPVPGRLVDGDVAVQADRIVVLERANAKHPTRKDARVPVTFRFELIEEGGRFVVDRVTATEERGRAVLEITGGRPGSM